MTQTSGYWTTSGAPSGHQVASYTQAIAAKAWAIIAACAGFEGVAAGYLNSLVGSVPGRIRRASGQVEQSSMGNGIKTTRLMT